jgi:hypothetical protein
MALAFFFAAGSFLYYDRCCLAEGTDFAVLSSSSDSSLYETISLSLPDGFFFGCSFLT